MYHVTVNFEETNEQTNSFVPELSLTSEWLHNWNPGGVPIHILLQETMGFFNG